MAPSPDFPRSFLEFRTISPSATDLLSAVAVELGDQVNGIAREIVTRHADEMTAAGLITEDDAYAWVLTLIRSVIAGLADPGAGGAAERAVIEELTADRARLGFPLDALLRSFQLGARALLEVLDATAARRPEATPSSMLEIHDFCWEWANEAMGVVAAAHRPVAIELARRDSARRAEFIAAVLTGSIPARRLLADAEVFGLDPRAHYVPFRARPADDGAASVLERQITAAASTATDRPAFTVIDGDLAGLAPRSPDAIDGPLAVGPAASLGHLAPAFAQASATLDTAAALGRRGTLALADVGPLPLALADSLPAQQLDARLGGRLEAGDRHGEIERTMRELLQHDQDITATAASLHVHPNTIRYRAGRFRELTALDVRRTEDLVLAWWWLTRRRAG